MNRDPNTQHQEDDSQLANNECFEKSEYDEWSEDDYNSRYRDWQSDNRSPY